MAKWIIGAVALVAVIAVTAVVAVSCTKSSGGSDKPTAAPTTSGAPASDFASANDTGPVSVITEDPSCAPWMPILNTLADAEANGWKERDPSIPATVWSQDVRTQYLAVADAMRSAAEQTAPLMKVTTHRVMRELYEQFIAYAEAYADHVPVYTAPDNQLALTAVGAAEVLSHICQAITYGSAAARAPLVEPAQPPTSVSPLGNSNRPVRFLTTPNLVCSDLRQAVDAFNATPEVAAWKGTDANIPASQWTPELRASATALKPVLESFAEKLNELGRQSSNSALEDFSTLAAQYMRAYVLSFPTFTRPDENLYDTSRLTAPMIVSACAAAGG
ncbi:Vmc-like lipoprotein signal peptide domain-containing protein [Mycolicibacterium fluoranthenivorans]|uniref:Uncharacterized protein n=1 Tax=Mycolicibacterium fluoranthenivorans TaxID=258505 RepID=A0A7X5ZFX4_9MYCO|nr:hypothetical protein [Mycolicibacterium fluoranthenivorans]MCV7357566.1 hypothetical protein [Mycolicibacterium fluoranthenivorans]NIH98547.1 hypothetical protein [Mycolicibacterium fluoranthenivorans]